MRTSGSRKRGSAKRTRRDLAPTRQKKLTISVTGDAELSGFVGQGAEPRFISEAYFLKFRSSPGTTTSPGASNWMAAKSSRSSTSRQRCSTTSPTKKTPGPRRHRHQPRRTGQGAGQDAGKPPRKRDQKEIDDDEKIDRAMNKTSTVTMWIDPQEYQVVRFTFDNVDWGFLPGRAIVRIDEAKASMTMGRVFEQIWLPRDVTFRGSATFASGTFRFGYRTRVLRLPPGRGQRKDPRLRAEGTVAMSRVRCRRHSGRALRHGSACRREPQAVVADVRVHGNYRTPDAVVLQLAGFDRRSAARPRGRRRHCRAPPQERPIRVASRSGSGTARSTNPATSRSSSWCRSFLAA